MSTYTPEQYERRRKSKWTMVQIIGAPLQLMVFFISLGFVLYTYATDQLFEVTTTTIFLKIVFLYFMCITGMFWEKDVFDHYYFAPEFFWEDFVTTFVMVTHSAYLVALFFPIDHKGLMLVIMIAYLSYLFNAGQYVWKWWKGRSEIRRTVAEAR